MNRTNWSDADRISPQNQNMLCSIALTKLSLTTQSLKAKNCIVWEQIKGSRNKSNDFDNRVKHDGRFCEIHSSKASCIKLCVDYLQASSLFS